VVACVVTGGFTGVGCVWAGEGAEGSTEIADDFGNEFCDDAVVDVGDACNCAEDLFWVGFAGLVPGTRRSKPPDDG